MSDLTLLLLGYPIAIFANFSTEFIRDYFKNQDETPFKEIFIKSFLESLNNNVGRVDSIGSKAIKECQKVIKKDKEKIFRIISMYMNNNNITLENIRGNSFIEELADEFIKEFDLFHITLAKGVIRDCLRNYEISFYSEMSTKDGLIYIVKLINKLNTEIAKPSDIEELKHFIVSEIKKIAIDPRLKNVTELISEETINPVSDKFSESIVLRMSSLKKTIENLTKDQYQIIHYLKFKKRVIISGCAGSGKTLLAAEKAIRLDNAGLKTLILTINPYLASHIRNLVATPTIDVFDFTNFIKSLLNKEPYSNDWNEFVEPLEEELLLAFNKILDNKISYDAIIIDEGQDFRELWWLIVEAISNNSTNKILYIFHDDRQSIFSFQTKYPVEESPFVMSKNCRNAGAIFDLVRKFHLNAPLTSELLKEKGVLKMSIFSSNEYEDLVERTIIDARKHVEVKHISIITNESSANNSVLNGLKVVSSKELNWRETVLADLNKLSKEATSRIMVFKEGQAFFLPPVSTLPYLSNDKIPNQEDINSVCEYAKMLSKYFGIKRVKNELKPEQYGNITFRTKKLNRKSHTSDPKVKLEFYMSQDWASKLLNTEVYEIIPLNDLKLQNGYDSIYLSTIDMFKGLESDGVLLFVNDMNKDIFKELYVGTSRAVGYLHLLINRTVYEKISQLKESKIS